MHVGPRRRSGRRRVHRRAGGLPELISFDMGGTSCDLALISDGAPEHHAGWKIEHKVPVQFPAVDVSTIGAGGARSPGSTRRERSARGRRARGRAPALPPTAAGAPSRRTRTRTWFWAASTPATSSAATCRSTPTSPAEAVDEGRRAARPHARGRGRGNPARVERQHGRRRASDQRRARATIRATTC